MYSNQLESNPRASAPSFFYSTVDTESPVLLLNSRAFNLLLQRSRSIHFRDVARHPVETTNVDCNKCPIRLLDSITIPISSNGWKVEDATFFFLKTKHAIFWVWTFMRSCGGDYPIAAKPIHFLEKCRMIRYRSTGDRILLNGTLMYLIVWVDQRTPKFILTSNSYLFLGK